MTSEGHLEEGVLFLIVSKGRPQPLMHYAPLYHSSVCGTIPILTSTNRATPSAFNRVVQAWFHVLLTRLEVLEEDVEALALLTVVSDDNAGAADDLPWVALSVDLAETSPGTQGLGVRDLEEVDLVLVAKSLDKLDVLLLGAGLDEDTEVSLTSVEGLGALSETSGKSIVDEGLLEDLLRRRHRTKRANVS